MVQEIKKDKRKYYICKECNFAYKEKQLAEKCEEWCKKHHSCNIEITKNAIQI